MIERQVFVTWYTPEEKLPKDSDIVVLTISGKAGNVAYDHALMLGDYVDGDGWIIYDIDPEEPDGSITIHAWCDLEPYGFCGGRQ